MKFRAVEISNPDGSGSIDISPTLDTDFPEEYDFMGSHVSIVILNDFYEISIYLHNIVEASQISFKEAIS